MPKQLFSTVKDIFSVGVWNGDKYDHKDLDEIVENFAKLKKEFPSFNVPLKIDLFKDAKPKDQRHGGQPTCGVITEIKKIGDRIYAHIEKIPEKIKDMIQNKAFQQVSAEIVLNLKVGQERLKHTLVGVALLGAELPGVHNLDEFYAFYDLDLDIEGAELKSYSFENNPPKDPEMKCEKCGTVLQHKQDDNEVICHKCGWNKGRKKFDQGGNPPMPDKTPRELELEEQLEKTNKDLKEYKEKQDAETKARKEAENKALKLANDQKSADIKNFVEKQKTEGRVLPAHETMLFSVMEKLDNVTVLKYSADGKTSEDVTPLDLMKRYIESLPKIVDFKEKSQSGTDPGKETKNVNDEEILKEFKEENPDIAGNVNGQKMHFLVKKYQEKEGYGKKSYTEIYEELAVKHPELK